MLTHLLENLLPLSVLAALVLCVWRFTSILARLAQSTARHDERNAEQRDRFFMQLLEQKAVASHADQAVQMAGVHSNEHLKTHNMNLARDATDVKAAAKAAKRADEERKNRERTLAADKTPVEGFSR